MGKKKILLVEDDPAMLEALRIEFTDAGYDVITCEDGECGLKEAMKGKADLIIMDILLPKMKGFEILAALKHAKSNAPRNIPVLVLTNLSQGVSKEKAMELGAVEYCVKATTDLNSLRRKVESMLR